MHSSRGVVIVMKHITLWVVLTRVLRLVNVRVEAFQLMAPLTRPHHCHPKQQPDGISLGITGMRREDRFDDDINDLWFAEENDDEDEEESVVGQKADAWWKDATEQQQQQHQSFLQEPEQTTRRVVPNRRGRPKKKLTRAYWDLRLSLLRDYKQKHGHIDVPYEFEVEVTPGPGSDYKSRLRLGEFLSRLRHISRKEGAKREDLVPANVIDELNSLGMTWKLGSGRRPRRFKSRLEEWKNATANNSTTSIFNSTNSLRQWMWNQRHLYAKQQQGQHGPLTPDRIEALSEAGILPYQRPQAILQSVWDSQWKQSLQKWQQQQQQHNVNGGSDPSLTLWAWEQQRMYEELSGTSRPSPLPLLLTGSRLQALTEAGFFDDATVPLTYPTIPPEWDVGTLSMDWDTVWSALQTFRKLHGHCRVMQQQQSADNNDEDDKACLYSMCRRLLWEYKHIQQRSDSIYRTDFLLNDNRIQQLKEINFFDETTTPDTPILAEYRWWESYHELRRYQYLYGTCQVVQESSDLYEWVQTQQEQYRNVRNGTREGILLPEAHYVALSELGMMWEDEPLEDADEPFARRTAESRFKGRRPAIFELDQDVLESNSVSFTSGTRKGSLEELAWQARYDEMRRHIQENGHSVVPADARLAMWAYNQRMQHEKYLRGEKTALTPKRISLLKEIGLDFVEEAGPVRDDDEEGWQSMLGALIRFKEAHGHCYVPVDLPGNPRLGQWVHTQRQLYQQQTNHLLKYSFSTRGGTKENTLNSNVSTLTEDRIRLLQEAGLDLKMDNIGFARKSFQVLWDARVAELLQFKSNFGHCNVGIEHRLVYFGLEKWIQEQRQFYKLWKDHGVPSPLTQERIDQLDSLGFVWEEDRG